MSVRRRLRARADQWIGARFARRVRRETTGREPSAELTGLVTESFLALYEPDGELIEPPAVVRDAIVRQFHNLWFGAGVSTWFNNTTYRGTPVLQHPFDLWIYQELIDRIRPALIIETGTWSGGSARYLGDLCALVGTGHVITIDIEHQQPVPEHERVTYLLGPSTSPEIVKQIRERLPANGPVMVMLDSDHSADHVLEELHLYAPMVTVGSYLIVEDTAVNGHPVWPSYGPGPFEAVEKFRETTNQMRASRSSSSRRIAAGSSSV